MSKIHYTEIFYSIQGEGRYMGTPSVFLRMFGCNFRCKNFGRYEKDILGIEETHNPDVKEVIKNIDQYKTFSDLPLVATGCDSYSSIYPEFKRFVIKDTIDNTVNKIIELLPFKEWRDEHLVITGGEPLLGWQKIYPSLLSHSSMRNLREITFETNGTQSLIPEMKEFLKNRKWLTSIADDKSGQTGRDQITFSVSAKLPVSGELWEDAIKPNVVVEYEEYGYTYLKFVISSEKDVEYIRKAEKEYRECGFKGPIYIMPVGGTESVYVMNNKNVAMIALSNGWRYSDRLQVPLFKNAWAT